MSSALFVALAPVACGGATSGSREGGDGGGSSSGTSSGGSSSSGSSSSGGADAGVPLNHRTSDALCQQPAPAGDCVGCMGSGGQPCNCSQDSECTAGTNGRCVVGADVGCTCSYDTCGQDSDCAAGQTCACHGSTYSDGGSVCVPSNCRVDSDCGLGGYCSPSAGGCGGVVGYYCHTATDECVNDSDCGGDPAACTYSTTDGRWECDMDLGCA